MNKNEIIKFGNFEWKVLEVKENNALLITKEIIELRWYHSSFETITWSDSEIRRYLNNEFYNLFSPQEKEKINLVELKNLDNPWFGTNGGEDTHDKIFLLSLDEVCKYFGNSKHKLLNKDNQKWLISDENNENRKAKYNNEYHWWRLRSPGYYDKTSAR